MQKVDVTYGTIEVDGQTRLVMWLDAEAEEVRQYYKDRFGSVFPVGVKRVGFEVPVLNSRRPILDSAPEAEKPVHRDDQEADQGGGEYQGIDSENAGKTDGTAPKSDQGSEPPPAGEAKQD